MLGLRERMEENGSAPGTGEAKRSAAAPADPEVVDRPLFQKDPHATGRNTSTPHRSEIRWMRRYASWSGETHGSRMSWKAHLIDVQGKVAGLLGISLRRDKLLKAADLAKPSV